MALRSLKSAEALLERARELADASDMRKALNAYRKVVGSVAHDPGLLVEAAVTAAQAGNLILATTWLNQAAAIAPRDAAIYFNLGEVARLDDKLDDAAANFRKACELAPGDADALYGLGETLSLLGQHDEANDVLKQAHQSAPDDTEIMNALGGALISNHEFGDAVEILRKALIIKPEYKDAWCNIAFALLRADRFQEADRAFRRADSMGGLPDHLLARWARTKLNVFDHSAAFSLADKSIQRNLNNTDSYYVRAAAHQHTGDFERAEADFRKALEFDPTHGEVYERLARMKRIREEDVERIKTHLADDSVPTSSRTSIGYALATYYDLNADYGEAAVWLRKANALKAAETPFSAPAHTKLISRVISVFDRPFFETRSGEGSASETAIFVFGMPRSGTTLCEQILAGYDEVFAGGERPDIQQLIKHLPEYPEMALSAGNDWARTNGETILTAMRDAAARHPRITNKVPGNYICLGLVHWLMPNARLIHCRRDPRDNALSCYQQHFRGGQSFTYDLDAFVVAYRQYRRIMAHWHEVLPGKILDVDYEALVGDPERTAKEIVSFCGLEWSPSCLDTHKVDRAVNTASFFQVRQPINTGSVGKWRRYESQFGSFFKALEAS